LLEKYKNELNLCKIQNKRYIRISIFLLTIVSLSLALFILIGYIQLIYEDDQVLYTKMISSEGEGIKWCSIVYPYIQNRSIYESHIFDKPLFITDFMKQNLFHEAASRSKVDVNVFGGVRSIRLKSILFLITR
jgi:hypothetical protein